MKLQVSLNKQEAKEALDLWRKGGPANAIALILEDQIKEIDLIDLEKEFWESIKKAAVESSWIPEEYFVNDWVSDVCKFLREGNKNV